LGNLYDYITSKEDILYIVQERAIQAATEAFSNNDVDHLDPTERLKTLISSEFDAMNKYQDLIMIIYQESHSMSKETLDSLLSSERKHIEQYEKVIEEGIRKGVFKPINIRMAANMIKMLIDGWVIKRWDLKGNVSFKEMKEGILRIVFDGILISSKSKIENHQKKVKN
jgi:AcrR family transcriptional regulator